MISINPTQGLVYDLKAQMPNADLEKSFESLLGLFMVAQGAVRLTQSKTKSASSLSRYLNHYRWSTKAMWGQLRRLQLEILLSCSSQGCPQLRVIVDLSSIEKRGEFKDLEPYMQMLDGKYGIHLSVLYLVIGKARIPWSLRLWQGAGSPSPSQLALKQIRQLPSCLRQSHQLIVLADGAYGNSIFLQGMNDLGVVTIVSMRSDRNLEDRRKLRDIRGCQEVRPTGLDFPVWATRFRLKGIKGKASQWRYVVANKKLSGQMIKRWGKRRWAIEAFFKTIKYRFGLKDFAQATRLAVYRWFLFALLAFTLAYQAHLHQPNASQKAWPDWQQAKNLALQFFLSQFFILYTLCLTFYLQDNAKRLGIVDHLCICKI
jgi:hypothetical protein